MEEHLVRSAQDAEYVVDLSNIVREKSFGGPGNRNLNRLRLVLDALVRRTGDPAVRVYLVADESLRSGAREFPDREDARTLDRWVEAGLVEEVGRADGRVLEIAAITGIPVISADGYTGDRDEHAWIQGNTSRFLKPVLKGGEVVLIVRDMGVRAAHEVTMGRERDALKKQGLLDQRGRPRLDVLSRAWRCPERTCSLYDVRKAGGSILLPRMRRGVPTCEIHGGPVIDDGPRPGSAQVKVMVGSRPRRFTLASDSVTTFGRHADVSLFELLGAEVAARISRVHVTVSIRDEVVLVRDVSTYGTQMRSAGHDFELGPWITLEPGIDYRFHPGDEVRLTDDVVLTRSGALFPAELPEAWRHATPTRRSPADGAIATTVQA